MWIKTNPNPCGRVVGDCVVRAAAIALGITWEDAFNILADAAFAMCDMPSSDSVLGAILRQRGFVRTAIPDSAPDNYTAEDFARDNPEGVFVLGFGGHVACVRSGNILDAWDSSQERPLFVWYRKDDY